MERPGKRRGTARATQALLVSGAGVAWIVATCALASAVSGCAWESGDDPVYYNQQQPRHQLANGGNASVSGAIEQPSGVAQTVGSADSTPAASAPVQAGVTNPVPSYCNPAYGKCDPEPSPWQGPGGGGTGSRIP